MGRPPCPASTSDAADAPTRQRRHRATALASPDRRSLGPTHAPRVAVNGGVQAGNGRYYPACIGEHWMSGVRALTAPMTRHPRGCRRRQAPKNPREGKIPCPCPKDQKLVLCSDVRVKNWSVLLRHPRHAWQGGMTAGFARAVIAGFHGAGDPPVARERNLSISPRAARTMQPLAAELKTSTVSRSLIFQAPTHLYYALHTCSWSSPASATSIFWSGTEGATPMKRA